MLEQIPHLDLERSILASVEPDYGEAEEIAAFIAEFGPDRVRSVLCGDGGAIVTEVNRRAMSLVRCSLASILNPSHGSTSALEADVIALAIGFPGMGSMTDVAKKHGVGKAAISKRAVAFCDENELPPSPYMKSKRARESYQRCNKRRQKKI